MRAGAPVLGTMLVEARAPEFVTALAAAGFELLFLDLEHGTYSLSDMKALSREARRVGALLVARTHVHDAAHLTRLLDAGARGVMIAHAEDPVELAPLVSATRFPPEGTRGYGLHGVVTDYRGEGPKELMARENEEVVVLLQLESEAATTRENLERLADLSGVDGWVVGPRDLSISLGVPGEHDHPREVAVVERVLEVGRRHGIATGVHEGDLGLLTRWASAGASILAFSSEVGLVLDAGRRVVGLLRRHAKA
ncbi:MAG: aldolase/citrate lyase family protein [Promethearchaeota archaeon]